MKVVKASWMISVFILGVVSSAQSIGPVMNAPAQGHDFDQLFTDAVRHFALQDGVRGIEENYGYAYS
ncbi:MAG: hypothetical protein HXS49_03990 [Theionarchaea archaeon]|nr:hypothetical protein [Theionarchaea archaeon]MBU7034325.1 hypothetical protein [Theionarchaea archaeon]